MFSDGDSVTLREPAPRSPIGIIDPPTLFHSPTGWCYRIRDPKSLTHGWQSEKGLVLDQRAQPKELFNLNESFAQHIDGREDRTRIPQHSAYAVIDQNLEQHKADDFDLRACLDMLVATQVEIISNILARDMFPLSSTCEVHIPFKPKCERCYGVGCKHCKNKRRGTCVRCHDSGKIVVKPHLSLILPKLLKHIEMNNLPYAKWDIFLNATSYLCEIDETVYHDEEAEVSLLAW